MPARGGCRAERTWCWAVIVAVALAGCASDESAPASRAPPPTETRPADPSTDADGPGEAGDGVDDGGVSGNGSADLPTGDGSSEGGADAGGSVTGNDAPDPPPLPRCDPEAAEGEPVSLRLWHGMSGDVERYFQVLIADFEAEHPDIRVEPVKIDTGYAGAVAELVDATDAEYPDVFMGSDQLVRVQAESGRFVPVTECTAGEHPDHLRDLLPVIEATFTVDGVLWAAPYTASTPVLLYNRQRWREAGLDPGAPPSSLEELLSVARDMVGSGLVESGLVLYDRSAMWLIQQSAAQSGRVLVEPDNGRTPPTSLSPSFATPANVAILEQLAAARADGIVRWIGTNESDLDDLIQLVHPTEPTGMTLHTSAALGDITRLVESGNLGDVEVGVAPFPGPGVGSTAGGAAWWLTDTGDPARVGAAWVLVDWLTAPARVAELAAFTGYVPTTERAADDPVTSAAWEEYPYLRVGYEQLAAARADAAGAGLQVGPVVELYRLLELAAKQAIDGGADPLVELEAAEATAVELMDAYADGAVGSTNGG